MSDADWIVLRFKRDVPMDQVLPELEGKWIDRSCLGDTYSAVREVEPGPSTPDTITKHTVARPTGRFEMSDDLDVAEIWEVENWGVAS
jgi:hypothetical protein